MNLKQVWSKVRVYGMGDAIDKRVNPQDILDPELAKLWADAQVKMNEIQIYLESNLPEEFINRK